MAVMEQGACSRGLAGRRRGRTEVSTGTIRTGVRVIRRPKERDCAQAQCWTTHLPRRDGELESCSSPGRSYWEHRDDASWSIRRVIRTCRAAPRRSPPRVPRGDRVRGARFFHTAHPIKQPNGKVVSAWAVEGDFDARSRAEQHLHDEWPPRSGTQMEFPEVDRGAWFGVNEARRKIFPAQVASSTNCSASSDRRNQAIDVRQRGGAGISARPLWCNDSQVSESV